MRKRGKQLVFAKCSDDFRKLFQYNRVPSNFYSTQRLLSKKLEYNFMNNHQLRVILPSLLLNYSYDKDYSYRCLYKYIYICSLKIVCLNLVLVHDVDFLFSVSDQCLLITIIVWKTRKSLKHAVGPLSHSGMPLHCCSL